MVTDKNVQRRSSVKYLQTYSTKTNRFVQSDKRMWEENYREIKLRLIDRKIAGLLSLVTTSLFKYGT